MKDTFAQRDAAIDFIVDDAERRGFPYRLKPQYAIPRGCPQIDVEVMTPQARILYAVLNTAEGLTDASAQKLMRAIRRQIDATGDNRTIQLYIKCLQARIEQLPPKCRQAALEYEKQQIHSDTI